jgi:hypothetical protein
VEAEHAPRPACPVCGTNEFCIRAGRNRKAGRDAQLFRCTKCFKNYLGPEDRATVRHWRRRTEPRRVARPEPVQPEGPPATCGIWRIVPELARSLSVMYRTAHNGVTPDQGQLDRFVSELLESAIGDFRLLHPREVFSAFGKPLLREARPKPADPCAQALPEEP